MTNPNPSRKKQKITYTASPESVEKAERALKRLGFESKSNFAKSQRISRSTVTKFFQRQPIQLDSFKRICEALTLSWDKIMEFPEKEQLESLKKTDCSNLIINKEMKIEMTNRRQVTVIDKKEIVKTVITLEGDIHSISNIKILESILREHSGDTIKIVDIQEGSIKLTIEGSQKDIERLVERIQSGELKEIDSFPIENVQIPSEYLNFGENTNVDFGTILEVKPQLNQKSESSVIMLPPVFSHISFLLIQTLFKTGHGEFRVRSEKRNDEFIVYLDSHVSYRHFLNRHQHEIILNAYQQVITALHNWQLSINTTAGIGTIKLQEFLQDSVMRTGLYFNISSEVKPQLNEKPESSIIMLPPVFSHMSFLLIQALSETGHGEFRVSTEKRNYAYVVYLSSHVSYRYLLSQKELALLHNMNDLVASSLRRPSDV
jgi:hypothetical protein